LLQTTTIVFISILDANAMTVSYVLLSSARTAQGVEYSKLSLFTIDKATLTNIDQSAQVCSCW
jgi:hypothetical protein